MKILELKSTITGIKDPLEGFDSISKLEELAKLKMDPFKLSNLKNRKGGKEWKEHEQRPV